MMGREILAVRGHRILVDEEDYEELNKHRWAVNVTGHAVRKIKCPDAKDGRRWLGMHRQIMGLPAGTRGKPGHVEVDHINGNRLDNRRSNLRICTREENVINRRGNGRTGFKGVSFHALTGLFTAEIRRGGVRKYLGSYQTAAEAHEVYCLWADMLHGEFSNHGHMRHSAMESSQGIRPPITPRISMEDAEEIRGLRGGMHVADVAAKYGIAVSYVYGIWSGRARVSKVAQ